MRARTVYELSTAPHVVTGCLNVINEIPASDQPITLLYHNSWWIHPKSALRLRNEARRLRARRPAKVIFCISGALGTLSLRLLGERAFRLNHNLHVREASYYPAPHPVEKKYSAVYTASLETYKRMHLAALVRPLRIVTYRKGQTKWDLPSFCPEIAHAEWNSEFLPEDAVREAYWQSRCGLALSQKEGPMLAAMEYLLSGLPIVSTRELGGRSDYRHDRYWFKVNANARDVLRGVEQAMAANLDPHEVRRLALNIVKQQRHEFARLVQQEIGPNAPSLESLEESIWGGPEGLFAHKRPSNAV